MLDIRDAVKRLAQREQIIIDNTWNWFIAGRPSKFAVVELDYCYTLEVPNVRVQYCRTEEELLHVYGKTMLTNAELPHRATFSLIDARQVEIQSLIT